LRHRLRAGLEFALASLRSKALGAGRTSGSGEQAVKPSLNLTAATFAEQGARLHAIWRSQGARPIGCGADSPQAGALGCPPKFSMDGVAARDWIPQRRQGSDAQDPREVRRRAPVVTEINLLGDLHREAGPALSTLRKLTLNHDERQAFVSACKRSPTLGSWRHSPQLVRLSRTSGGMQWMRS